MEDIRQKIVNEASSWLGTPYHHMGRIKGAGVDCGTLLIEVFSAVGLVPNFDTGYYPIDWAMHKGEERYLGFVEKYAIPTNEPQPGDIVLYKFGRCISHAGIVVNSPFMIHAYFKTKNVTLSEIDEGELKERIFGFYTVVGK